MDRILANQSDQVVASSVGTNSDAFSVLYQRHLNRVYRYILFRVGQVEDAQDLTTQTFIGALEGIDGYQGKGAFRSWLLGIASHKVADYYRKQHKVVPIEAVEQHPEQVQAPTLSLDELVSNQLQREQVVQTLSYLSPERAEAISLRFFAELTVPEIGQIMGKKEPAVRMLLHRGIQDLRRRLLREEEDHVTTDA